MPARKSIRRYKKYRDTMKDAFEEVDLFKTGLATRVNEINKERDNMLTKKQKK